ncbi:hypothetical protein G7Y89_g8692 [Cudoniella acicularis]|uniref:rRNA biogenesis protein RRP36 n=1 Tax=Cudoniella acicularis TaxID=354080 RepID=A0A8H4RG43_9HELO|nr:hypothetical protein G7Y89_g8692 [Cudoniella acicularis]
MSSTKRKTLDTVLQRRVRARREESKELESVKSVLSEDQASEEENDPSSGDEDGSELGSNESESESEEEPEEVASISFGALAKAEATLSGSGKRKKKSVEAGKDDGWENNEALERKAGRKDRRDFSRASKHAPTELSSKKAVSRKREVVFVIKRQARDPRFEPTNGPADEGKIRKLYGFLDDYREDEMKELKGKIKSTKDEAEKERLKRTLLSMEEKKKAQARRDREQAVLDRHRKEEKELVKQGKKPFYLKKTEQKKRVLLDQYGELKGKQLDHVIVRRRKKVEGKEKKNMPFARRAQS